MSKFLVLWESVPGYMPADSKQRMELQGKLMEMTKQALDKGEIKDWGLFPGGNAGYGISEGTEADALKRAMQFAPYIKFTVHPVLTIDQVAGVMKSLTG